MSPAEIIATGSALEKLTAFGLIAVYAIAVTLALVWAIRKAFDLSEKHSATVLKVTSDGIEAEKDMTQALNLLAGKIGK